MDKHKVAFAGVFTLLLACGGGGQDSEGPKRPEPAPAPVESAEPVPQATERPADLPWWQGDTPACSEGELKRRTLSWGSVFWCAQSGARIDQNLQGDLSKLARCVHESVSAFQEEPEPEKLGAFLARANDSEINPVLCAAVRVDGEVRTYHGRRVLMERRVQKESESETVVQYRFGCEECKVAAETSATVSTP